MNSYYEFSPDGSNVVVDVKLMSIKDALIYTEIFGGEILDHKIITVHNINEVISKQTN